MAERGWSSSMFEVQCIQFADWLAEEQADGTVPLAVAFHQTGRSTDDDTLRAVVAHHARLGHVSQFEALGGIQSLSAHLNDEGMEAFRLRSERRQNRRARRIACRDAVLDWLDSRASGPEPDEVADMQGDARAYFEGDPFDSAEVEEAGVYLTQRDLIAGINVAESKAPLMPHLTTDGQACVDHYEGSVQRAQGTRATQVTTHFHGPMSGQVGIASGDVHQTQYQGIDAETLQRLLDDIRQAAEQIDPADAAYLRTYVDTLQAEATADQPNTAIVTGTVERLQQIGGKAGSAALSASVANLVNAVLPAVGIG